MLRIQHARRSMSWLRVHRLVGNSNSSGASWFSGSSGSRFSLGHRRVENLFILTQTRSRKKVSFSGLTKGIFPKMCILCVRVKINKRSFEPFCVWILF